MSKILIVVGLLVLISSGLIIYKQKTSESVAPTVVGNTEVTNVSEVLDKKNEPAIPGSIKILDLSNQGFKTVPSYVFGKIDTQELDLSGNELSGSLPGEIRSLQSLKVLDLSNNQFTGVPAEIGQLVNLEVLNLSNNQITGLPHELGNLSSLKVLNLKGNSYTVADLSVIRQSLPSSTVVEID